ncbi:MAG TPA: GldM family protein, partial [Cytophagales bacterium]|nr:GldM family protein [Cytophagales bacterium]
LKLFSGRKEVSEKEGLKLPLTEDLKVGIYADEDFAKVCPNDTKYKVTEVEVLVIRGKRKLYGPQVFRNGHIAMTEIRKIELREGDRIYIETKKVQRANFRGEIEEVKSVESWNIFLYNN